MTITPSTLVAAETTITDKDSLWQPPVFFMHHWGDLDGCEVETSWRTVITKSRSNAEQRFSLVEKPRRAMTARNLGWNCRERGLHLLRNNLARMGEARQPFPLYPDKVTITAKGKASPNVYVTDQDIDTRRFFVGGRVLAANIENDHPQYVDDLQIRAITAIDTVNNEITLDGSLGETYTGNITVVQEEWESNASTTTPYTTSASFTLQDDDVLVITVTTGQISVNSTLSSVVWNGPSPTVTMTAVTNAETVVDPTSGRRSQMRQYYCRPTSGAGSGTVTITFVGSPASLVVMGHVLRGVRTTTPPWQAKDDVTVFEASSGTPPVDNTLTIARVTDTEADWFIGLMLVTNANFEAANLSINSPSQLNVAVDRDDLSTVAVAGFSALMGGFGGSSVVGRWDYNTLPAAGDRFGFIGASYASTLDVLDTSPKRYLWPLMECNLDLDLAYGARSGEVAESEITVQETAGPPAIDPIRTPNTVNSSWPTHEEDSGFEFPIFDYFPDWTQVDISFVREGRSNTIGTEVAFDVYGSRPLARINANFKGLNRDNVFDLMEFFDSRAGRTYPFWYVSPTHDYEFISNDGATELVVTASGAEEDWNLHPFIAVVMKNGTYYIRRISSTTRVSGTDEITVSSSITSLTASDIKKVSVAYLCRFDTDTFRERWTTDEVQDVNLSIRELDYDKEIGDVDISLDNFAPGGSGDDWDGTTEPSCTTQCCGSACNVCTDAVWVNPVTLTCTCYEAGSGPDCDPCDTPAYVINNITIQFSPVSCISNVMRWESGDAYVELDTDGPTWTYDLGSYQCCADLTIFTACLCATTGADCSPNEVITESCQGYTKQITVEYPECDLVTVLQITCETCFTGAC